MIMPFYMFARHTQALSMPPVVAQQTPHAAPCYRMAVTGYLLVLVVDFSLAARGNVLVNITRSPLLVIFCSTRSV